MRAVVTQMTVKGGVSGEDNWMGLFVGLVGGEGSSGVVGLRSLMGEYRRGMRRV